MSEPTTAQRLNWSERQSNRDGWTEVRTSFYNELLQNHNELRDLLQAISDEYNLLEGVCMLSQCHHKQCEWRRSINRQLAEKI